MKENIEEEVSTTITRSMEKKDQRNPIKIKSEKMIKKAKKDQENREKGKKRMLDDIENAEKQKK